MVLSMNNKDKTFLFIFFIYVEQNQHFLKNFMWRAPGGSVLSHQTREWVVEEVQVCVCVYIYGGGVYLVYLSSSL